VYNWWLASAGKLLMEAGHATRTLVGFLSGCSVMLVIMQ
jgi:hypothetical protein